MSSWALSVELRMAIIRALCSDAWFSSTAR